MKQETHKVDKIIYYCDLCDYHSHIKDEVIRHEKKHNCKHNNVEYCVDMFENDYQCFLIKECSNCLTKLGKIDINECEDQQILEKIYNILSKD